MNTTSSAASPRPVDLSAESVAGEEDPGATLDLAGAGARGAAAGGGGGSDPAQPAPRSTPPMSPGDEAPVGTPGTGEDVCGTCGGSGQLNGSRCPACEGTGKVNVGIGGA
ncbi:hypothetical protein JI739_08135 [Ramlibacter sp. AW1]|uniref:Uncharacterized protein n=1 Tax=Ramlibacter aurantiacus TaxID=2801330 RepID=A0A936ZN18_9BURK|nr:hypothetical protein [Ramlibacter aurantiacus]MBL0420310.1 hypothetical protein [Ramlibacter aurantiacus]